MVGPLDRKLLRDLAQMRGQVITIALVVACAITSYVTLRSAYDSLLFSRDSYYADYRFADVFAALKRAPISLRSELEALPFVQKVELRVMRPVLVPLSGRPRPASGTVVSIDHARRGFALNDVYVNRGRDLDPSHPDEVLLLSGFAEAHGLGPGASLSVVINGTLKELKVVGTAMSPEYIMPIAPGQLSYDPSQVPVMWMSLDVLQAGFRMEGAFNHVSLALEPSADRLGVLAAVDKLLEPYGGYGALLRDKQPSNYVLGGELVQLKNMAGFVPYLFLFVAALLVNVVLSRLVQLERSIIATLKALGYRDAAIGYHYLKLVFVIVLIGALVGVIVGAWFGSAMMEMYTSRFFRFPSPDYRLEPKTVVFSVFVSFAAAFIGAIVTVTRVARLPPAEAMRPPAPLKYRRSLLERVGLFRLFDPAMRMMWRELSRRPLRLVLSAVGVALSIAILVVARSMWDSMDYLIDVQFHRSMREDMNVTLVTPAAPRAVSELRHVPGVLHAEGLRTVPVRFRSGHRWRDSAIVGYPSHTKLRRLLDDQARVRDVPPDGVMLTAKLAEVLGVNAGDAVTVEFREGDFATHHVTVSALLAEPFGLSGHMNARALAELLDDTGPINTVLLRVDPEFSDDVERRLGGLPLVQGVSSPHDFKRQFNEQSAAMVGVFTLILTLFASVIAVGVIYNNARVALSQRSRDLGSLRVLGFTQREIASMLFGEQAIQVLLAIPLGLVLGRLLSVAMMSNVDPETYRMPVVISAKTYVFAVLVTFASTLASALLLRQKLRALDLISVLKTRE